MPLLLAIPLLAGFAGLFAGSQIDRAVDNVTTPVGGGTAENKMPWYITLALVAVGVICVALVIKKIMKK
jgi:hypothetical protein